MENRSRFPAPVRRIARRVLNSVAVFGNVNTGANFNAGRGSIISAPHNLDIGHDVSVGPRSIIQVDGSIGDFVMIGMGVQIVGREDHAIDELGIPMRYSTWVGDRPQRPRDSVVIGTDVWIGGGSVILSGVSVGDGAVIGAGSVVTKDVLPFTVVGGVPARELGARFVSDEQREVHLAKLKSYKLR